MSVAVSVDEEDPPRLTELACQREKTVRLTVPLEFTWYLQLKNKKYVEEFNRFKMKHSLSYPQIFYIIVRTFAILIYIVRWSRYRSPQHLFLVLFAAVNTLLLLVYGYCVRSSYHGAVLRYLSVAALGDIVIISSALLSGFYCLLSDLAIVHYAIFPFLNLIIGVILVPIMFCCHNSWSALLSAIISLAFLVASSYEEKTFSGLMAFMGFAMIGMYETEFNVSHSFVSFLKVENALASKVNAELETQRVQNSMAELRSIIGNVAHDLKTPLQAFVSELDNLDLVALTENEKREKSVGSLKSACHFMNMTINRSLDFAKVTSGFTLVPRNSSVNIRACIEWATNCILPIVSKQIHIKISSIPLNICEFVLTDKQWLLENLLCLMSNSIKYVCNEGTVDLRVSLETTQNTFREDFSSTPKMLLFEVEDDGIGISTENLAKLFHLFYQVQKNAGGTGLGLFALFNRSQAIGGRCGVSPRRDNSRGTLIWFTIPYLPDMTAQNTAALYSSVESASNKSTNDRSETQVKSVRSLSNGTEATMDQYQQAKADQNSLNILLVEDSKLIQKASIKLLGNIGHNVDVANNGCEGLDALSNKRYEADVSVKAISDEGFDLLHRPPLKTERNFVIGVSANSDSVTRSQALDAGMDDFIEKPLSISTLREVCLMYGLIL